MSWLWLAVLVEPPPSRGPAPLARATLAGHEGAPAGWLAAWAPDVHPPVPAAKVDGRVIDPDGDAGIASLALAPRGRRIAFDDPSVQGARRAVLAGPPRRLVSTLVRGDSLFAGAITALPDEEPPGVVDDPFGRVVPAGLVHVGPGILGRPSAPAGPVIERYGSGNPWPWDRFEDVRMNVDGAAK